MNLATLDRIRAIECLRGGVPSRNVVRFLPPGQLDIKEGFADLLRNLPHADSHGTKPQHSMLLEGNFGTGKSHWLQYFRDEALANGFICSSVSLNKETPLHDISKLFRQCVDASSAERSIGSAIYQIVLSYNTDKAPGFRDMFMWAQGASTNGTLDKRLFASLEIFNETVDEEVRALLLREWIGFPMPVSYFRDLLQDYGLNTRGISRLSNSDYGQRFEFLSRLIVSAGFKGWIILIDELEVVAKYTLLQRTKSYANLAQLFGRSRIPPPEFVGVVATITTDYVAEVLRGARKNDREQIPNKYAEGKNQQLVPDAVSGMKLIEKSRISMHVPKQPEVDAAYESVAALYSEAYDDWNTPDVSTQHEYSSTGRMRQYVRSWINAWDLRRTYDYETRPEDIVIDDVKLDYEEDPDRQSEPMEDDEPMPTY